MPTKTEVRTDLLTRTGTRAFARVRWYGGKGLHDAILAYQKEREVFCKKNNMKVAQVDEFLKQPEVLVNSASVKASVSVKGAAEKAGRVATTTRVSRVKSAAVTKRVAKKSK